MMVDWVGPGGSSGSRLVLNETVDIGPLVDGTVVTFRSLSGSPSYEGAVFAEVKTNPSSGGVSLVKPTGGAVNIELSDCAQITAAFICATATTSSQSVAAGQNWSDDMEFSVPDDFYFVSPVFANYDTTQSLTVSGFTVAPAGAHKAVQNTLTWTAGTVSGSASFTLAAATTGAGGQVVPSIAVADPIPVASLARSDSGTSKLIRVIETLATSGSPRTILFKGNWSGQVTAINTDPANGGAQVAGVYNANANWSTTPGANTPADNASLPSCIVGVLVGSATRKITGAVFGDSRDAGLSSASGYMGWPIRANFLNGTVNFISLANSGQKTVDSIATMKNFVTAYNPAFVTMGAWSPNDGSTLAAANTAWGAIMAAAEWCRQRKVTFILRTPLCASAATYPNAMTIVNRVKALRPSRYLFTIDTNATVSDGAFNMLPAYNSGDNLHFNDAGYTAIAATVVSALQGF